MVTVSLWSVVVVRCEIGRGAFSSERTFYLTLADGRSYSGVSPKQYCHAPCPEFDLTDEQVAACRFPGYIDGQFCRIDGDVATVEFPNGEAWDVPRGTVSRVVTSTSVEYEPI